MKESRPLWKLIRRPLFLFFALLTLLFTGALAFVQSEKFADIVKRSAARLIPGDLGVDGDFSDFSISVFPPTLSINEPSLRLRERNILGMPDGSQVTANQIRLVFRFFQSLSGSISVDRVVVEGGEIDLKISTAEQREKSQRKKKGGLFESWMQGKLGIHWEDLLRVRAESIELENTHVKLALIESDVTLDIDARALRLARSEGVSVALDSPRLPIPLLGRSSTSGWAVSLDLGALQIEVPSQTLPSWLKAVRPAIQGQSPPRARIEGFSQVRADAFVDALGLRLDRLAFERNGLGVDIRGQLRGDLLAPAGDALSFNVKTEVSGDLKRMLQEIAPSQVSATGRSRLKQTESILGVERSGSLAVQLQAQGNLLDLMRTTQVQGQIRGRNLRWDSWYTDQLEVEGSWEGRTNSEWGTFDVRKIVVSSEERPRVGIQSPGSGGEIRIENLRFSPGSTQEVTAPVELDRVHLHWLAASALQDVWPLDFRVSGSSLVRVQLPDSQLRKKQGWNVTADLKLGIDRFVLDNQKPGRLKARTVVLDIPQLNVRGGVRIDPVGIHSEGFKLLLPHSELRAQGRVDFKDGFQLNVEGPIDLSDVGQLAETPIRGEGILKARVYGPSSRVMIDFDPDLKNAAYLNLNFGDLKGKLVYDEDPQHLFIKNVHARQRSLDYTVDGKLDLSDAETVNLDADVLHGDISDLSEVFSHLVSDISWYPRSLTGSVKGKIQIKGGLDLNKLIIEGRLGGQGWNYWGESFQEVALRGGYDRGVYQIEEFRALKKTGRVQGKVAWSATGGIDWSLRTDELSVGDFDTLARLDVPIRGKVLLSSSGRGKEGKIISTSRLQVVDAGVRGNAVPSSELLIESAEGRMKWEGVALGGQGELSALIDHSPGSISQVKLRLSDLDFSPLLLLLNPKLMQDRELKGQVSGAIQISYPNAQFEKASGIVSLSRFELGRMGTRFELKQPRSIKLQQGEFTLEDLALVSSRGQTATLALTSESGRWEGELAGAVDLGLLEFLTSAVERSQGSVGLNLAVAGELLAPTVSGSISLGESGFLGMVRPGNSATAPRIKLASLESPIENVSGVLQLKQGRVLVSQLTGELAGGTVLGSGDIELFPNRWPVLNLEVDLSGNKIKVWPFQYAKVRGKLNIKGDTVPWLISGNLEVDDAISKEKLSSGATSGASGSLARYSPPPGSGSDSSFPKFILDIGVESSKGVFVRNDLFDVELGAKIRVINTLDSPRITGTTQVLRGNMIFRDRVFQIQTATVDFDNPAILDPKLNLAGFTEVSGTRINLSVSGRTSGYQVDFTSNPVLPESEILSLLALGFTSGDMQKLKSGDRSSIEQSEAASLVLHSTDFNRDLESKTGLRIQIDEAVASDVGTSIFRPRSETEVGTAPKIVIKRQIGKRVDVSVGSTVGVGTNSQQEVNAEFKVTPAFSIIGVWDTLEGADSQARESYGVDLKVQKRFK